MTGTDLDLSGIDFGIGTLTNGWEAQFINGSQELDGAGRRYFPAKGRVDLM